MKPLTAVKLALALSGVILFGIGIRLDSSNIRFSGIGLVVAAWILRFAKDRDGK
ncbi:MAG: hypothetical protein ACHQQ3_10510 [Gemmatimonadales bacterium]